jgi:hypothetical protein
MVDLVNQLREGWMCIHKGDEGQRIIISTKSGRGLIVARTELD